MPEGGREADPVDLRSPPDDEELAALLKALRADDQNPELWVQAGRAFLARGELGQALRCGRAASRLDPEGEGSRGLMTKLKSKGVDAREGGAAGATPEGAGPRQGADAPSSGTSLPLSPGQAASQLARELAPRETVTCPGCGTEVEVDEPWCYGCGQEMGEAPTSREVDLQERVNHARGRLEADPEDVDALFTMGANLALREEFEEALEVLNRLTLLEAGYPGLWWLKARVFEGLGKEKAAEAAMRQAMKGGPG